jgi:hypothetical protein
MKSIEDLGGNDKLIHVFPLRSTIIPQNFRLDTTSLIVLLFRPMDGKKQIYHEGQKKDYMGKDNLVPRSDEVWNKFFNLKKKCFHLNPQTQDIIEKEKKDNHNKYNFHHMIETDGVSCSIILSRTINSNEKKIKILKLKSILMKSLIQIVID